MDFILKSLSQLMNTGLLVAVILAAVASGIALLLLFLMARPRMAIFSRAAI